MLIGCPFVAQAGDRPTLVALLAPPKVAADDPFLRAAELHYAALPDTTALVRLGSLAELHGWLIRQAEAHGVAGEIVLVGHGSAWTGLLVDLYPDATPASPSQMQAAGANGSFPTLPEGVVDAHTHWRLDSCAVGRHQAWLEAFAALWLGPAQPVRLSADKDFVVFQHGLDHAGRIHSERSQAPVQIQVQAGPAPPQPQRQVRTTASGCAPLNPPCEHRRVPIRVEYRAPAEAGRARRAPRRRPDDPALETRLRDLNLRSGQLRWRQQRAATGGSLWVGEATAEMIVPSNAQWQVPELSIRQ